jgi:hypothetical protein
VHICIRLHVCVCYMNGQARFAIRQLYIGPKLLSFLLQDLAFVIYIYIPFFWFMLDSSVKLRFLFHSYCFHVDD